MYSKTCVNYMYRSGCSYLLTSQLQTTFARKVFPCLDEPAFKATFNVSVDRRPPHTSKSNTGVIETRDAGYVHQHTNSYA